METKLQKWGNSDGIRIPNYILKSLKLKTNDKLNIIEEDNKIVIYKIEKEHFTLEDRIEEYNKLSKKDKGSIESYDWGEDVGLEKWE